jgi:hypothetical protein
MLDDDSMGLLYAELVRQLREEAAAREHFARARKAERRHARARATRNWLASLPRHLLISRRVRVQSGKPTRARCGGRPRSTPC